MDRALPTEVERASIYEAELIRRYRAGEYLTATDRREARRIIKAKETVR